MNRDRRRGALWLAVLVLAAASGEDARALTDEEIFREFRFNFISPGAHALGLGGAYISAATDATAAEANPAALQYVSKKQFFVEYRRTEPDDQFLRPSGGARDFPDVGSTENWANFLTVSSRDDTNSLSFASFVLPFRIGKKRATIAFSRQVVLDGQNSLTSGERETFLDVSLESFPVVVIPDPPRPRRYAVHNTVNGNLDAELLHYNLGFSVSVHRDFSVGITANLAELDVTSTVNSNTEDPLGVLFSVHPRVDTGDGLSDIQRLTTIGDTDTDLGYTVGLHWHPDSVFPSGVSPVRFGLVYRNGADLAVDERVQEFNAVTGEFEELRRFDNVLKVPDRWGVGASYFGKQWLVSVDVERIQYSDLLDGYVTGVNFFTSDAFPPTLLPGVTNLRFDVDDATVARVGGEYAFVTRGQWQYAIRGGYFNQPDSKIALKSVGDDTIDSDVEAILLDLFREGDDVDHFTVGVTLGAPQGIQLQFAGDFSDAGDVLVGSVIYQFGKTVLGR
jgi:hypothetical protein